jgi:hypothetical protein
VKPILLIVTAIVALGSIVARADAIDTEHLFDFTIGTDIGEVGEKEFESNTLSRLGKRSGSYPRSPSRFPWNIRRYRIFVSK